MDFVHVMKDWRRMCQYMEKEYGNSCCDKCPLDGCYTVYKILSNENFLNIERDIVAWATEHPEPKYPTWYEYLSKMYRAADGMSVIGRQPIPADIAKRLGIQPKEG